LSTLGFVSARHGERLVYAELQEFWPALREDYERLYAAYYLLALINTHFLDNAADSNVWDFLVGGLQYLEIHRFDEQELLFFVHVFEKNIGAALGYGEEEGGRMVTAGVASFRPLWYY